jgi:hypothetical protein
MSARTLFSAAAFALLTGLALLAACGDDDSETVTSTPSGQLTDPRTVATAAPWDVPPDVTIVEPEANPTPEPTNGSNGGNGGGTPGVCGATYIVEPGDSPSLIAQECGVDVDELMQLNGIDDPTLLQVGQELLLP